MLPEILAASCCLLDHPSPRSAARHTHTRAHARCLSTGAPRTTPTAPCAALQLMPELWARMVPIVAPHVMRLVEERRNRPPPSAGFRHQGPSTGGFEVRASSAPPCLPLPPLSHAASPPPFRLPSSFFVPVCRCGLTHVAGVVEGQRTRGALHPPHRNYPNNEMNPQGRRGRRLHGMSHA